MKTTTPTLSRVSAASQLRPLPSSLRGVSCFACNRPQSSWWIEAFEPVEKENKMYLCALCLLYDSEWGRKAREAIEEVVRQVEAARDKEFESDESNRLVVPKDADDVLGVIVLSQRAAAMRSRELAR